MNCRSPVGAPDRPVRPSSSRVPTRPALTEARQPNEPPASRPVNSGPRPCLFDVGFPLSGLQDRIHTSDLNVRARHTRLALRARLRVDTRVLPPTRAIRQHQHQQQPTRSGATSCVRAGATPNARSVRLAHATVTQPIGGSGPLRPATSGPWPRPQHFSASCRAFVVCAVSIRDDEALGPLA